MPSIRRAPRQNSDAVDILQDRMFDVQPTGREASRDKLRAFSWYLEGKITETHADGDTA
jgi:hypothetical protein